MKLAAEVVVDVDHCRFGGPQKQWNPLNVLQIAVKRRVLIDRDSVQPVLTSRVVGDSIHKHAEKTHVKRQGMLPASQ